MGPASSKVMMVAVSHRWWKRGHDLNQPQASGDGGQPLAQEILALLIARKQLLGRLIDVELIIGGFCAALGWSWPCDAEDSRSTDPKVGCRPGDIGAHWHCDAFGTILFEGRVRKVALGDDAVCRRLT